MCQPLLSPVSILLHNIGYSYPNTGICFGIMMGAVVHKSMADLRYFGECIVNTAGILWSKCFNQIMEMQRVGGTQSLFIRVPSAAYGQRVTPLFAV